MPRQTIRLYRSHMAFAATENVRSETSTELVRPTLVSAFWRSTMRSIILLSLLCVLSAPTFAEELARPATPEKPHIDVVFCLDCSGSMGPVIETAKQKVWSTVNEITRAKPSPILRIGLLGYGNFDKEYRQFDLTDDLDIV